MQCPSCGDKDFNGSFCEGCGYYSTEIDEGIV